MDLNQVTLPAHDPEASIRFYELLGLEIIVDSRPRYVRFVFPGGNSSLSLHHVPQAPSGPGVQIYFECEDLDERVDRLSKAGLAFESGPTDQPWLWREAWLRDPSGNQVCLFWAGENRLDPPWRVTKA